VNVPWYVGLLGKTFKTRQNAGLPLRETWDIPSFLLEVVDHVSSPQTVA
jgi:hypothetical protein